MMRIRLLRAILPVLASLLLVPACAPKPTSIRVGAQKMTIYGLKRTGIAKAEVLDAKGMPIPSAVIRWESSKPPVASVDGTGLVKAASPGRTILTASFEKLSGRIQVDVVDVATVTVSPSRTTLIGGKGARTTFTAEARDSADKPVQAKPVWTVTTPAVATIDAEGVVTAVSQGRTGVVASLGEISGPADLTVLFQDLASFEVTPLTIILKAGDSQKLNVLARDVSGRLIDEIAVVWTSDEPKAAIAAGGMVRGLSPGHARIRATCATRTAEISVIVLP